MRSNIKSFPKGVSLEVRNMEDISVCQRNNVWENQLCSTFQQCWGSKISKYKQC